MNLNNLCSTCVTGTQSKNRTLSDSSAAILIIIIAIILISSLGGRIFGGYGNYAGYGGFAAYGYTPRLRRRC